MNATTSSPKRSRRFWLAAVAAGLVGAVAAVSAGRASHGHGWCRHGHGFGEVNSPGEAREQAHSAMRWMLLEIDATEQQKERIGAIVDESVDQIFPLVVRHRQHHRELVEALSRPTIDRDEVERLRQAEIEVADAASNRFADSTLDVFDVLTAEQRAEVVAHMRERHM